MTKDIVGNDIKVGDLICLDKIISRIPYPIVGEIISINDVGIVPPNLPKNAVVPGNIQVRILTNLNYNPTLPLDVVKVVRPPEQANN